LISIWAKGWLIVSIKICEGQLRLNPHSIFNFHKKRGGRRISVVAQQIMEKCQYFSILISKSYLPKAEFTSVLFGRLIYLFVALSIVKTIIPNLAQ